jgi:hypothetical protein
MARHCTVCHHPERSAIDAALRSGESLRTIGRAFHVTHRALGRHKVHHLDRPTAMRSARLDRMRSALQVSHNLLVLGSDAPNLTAALATIQRARALLDGA